MTPILVGVARSVRTVVRSEGVRSESVRTVRSERGRGSSRRIGRREGEWRG